MSQFVNMSNGFTDETEIGCEGGEVMDDRAAVDDQLNLEMSGEEYEDEACNLCMLIMGFLVVVGCCLIIFVLFIYVKCITLI